MLSSPPQDVITPDVQTGGKQKNSRFELFANIFKKKTCADQVDSSVDVINASLKASPDAVDDEDKETSVAPTLTCSEHQLLHSKPIEIATGRSSNDVALLDNASVTSSADTFSVLSKSPVSPRVRSLHLDMQALRRSRQDNPYIQHKLERLSLQEEPPFSSPRKQEQEKLVESEDECEMEDGINLHEHLIRSPPPQFPRDVTQFMFPTQQHVITSHPVIPDSVPIIRPAAEVNLFRPPLLPIDETFDPKRSLTDNNKLNPLVVKSGVDMLDPGMREVLQFQKHKIVYENRMEPFVPSPSESGRMSVDLHYHQHVTLGQRSSISSCQRSTPLKLQPMWSPPPPSTAPSPRPVSFPTGGPVVIGGQAPSVTSLSVGGGPVLPPVSGAGPMKRGNNSNGGSRTLVN